MTIIREFNEAVMCAFLSPQNLPLSLLCLLEDKQADRLKAGERWRWTHETQNGESERKAKQEEEMQARDK